MKTETHDLSNRIVSTKQLHFGMLDKLLGYWDSTQ